jgi:hypothetical protein
MAHFARVENGIVKEVIVLDNKDCGGGDFPESEDVGKAYIESLGISGDWLQTSYNKNFRGNFAGKGLTYSPGVDMFHDVSPFPSWVLGDDGTWSAPTPSPEGPHYWDEGSTSWVSAEE